MCASVSVCVIVCGVVNSSKFCPLSLSRSPASFIGQENYCFFLFFCYWVAAAEAFESHLMFARLQGSPLRSRLMSHVMSEQR